jgi:glycosyltransferase involved in cell wall biosynthesis
VTGDKQLMVDCAHHHPPRTILLMNLYAEMGGGEYALSHVLKGLDKLAYVPIMMFNKRGSFVEKVESLGVRTVILPYPTIMLRELVNPVKLWETIQGSRRIYSFLRENRIDIIQCGDVLSLLFIAWPVIRLRIPVMYTVIFYYEWTRLLLLNVLAVLLVKMIITNSLAVRDDLLRRSVLLGRKVGAIHPGVDVHVFHPRRGPAPNMLREEFHLPENMRLVGMAGRFDPSKGHSFFLEAAARVLRQRKDVKFFIAGGVLFSDAIPSLAGYHEGILREHAELGLRDAVFFLHHRDDMPEILRSLDLLVCPSVNEGFGLVILEALASGVPVVLSPRVGAFELVKNLECVFVAEPCDSESFAMSIQHALAARPNQEAGPIRSYLPDDRMFGWEACVQRYQEAYDSLTVVPGEE